MNYQKLTIQQSLTILTDMKTPIAEAHLMLTTLAKEVENLKIEMFKDNSKVNELLPLFEKKKLQFNYVNGYIDALLEKPIDSKYSL